MNNLTQTPLLLIHYSKQFLPPASIFLKQKNCSKHQNLMSTLEALCWWGWKAAKTTTEASQKNAKSDHGKRSQIYNIINRSLSTSSE